MFSGPVIVLMLVAFISPGQVSSTTTITAAPTETPVTTLISRHAATSTPAITSTPANTAPSANTTAPAKTKSSTNQTQTGAATSAITTTPTPSKSQLAISTQAISPSPNSTNSSESVSISGWKAKEGECEDKCEGAAGPFKIVRTCEPKDSNQCKNVTLTGTSEDCLKYCPSNAVAIAVSTLVLAIGMFLSSFSFH